MGHHLSRIIRRKSYNDNNDNIKRKEMIRCLNEMDKELKMMINELHDIVDRHNNTKNLELHKQVNKNYLFDKDV
jgi:hypothetical protein